MDKPFSSQITGKGLRNKPIGKDLRNDRFLVWSNLCRLIDAVMLKEAGGRIDLFPSILWVRPTGLR